MIIETFWISIVLNARLVGSCGFLLLKLHRAHMEISRKEGVIRILQQKSRQNDSISFQYFTEEKLEAGLLSTKYLVKFMLQISLNNIPISGPFKLRENSYKIVDKDQVNQILEDYAKPLIE